jgi:hypothetical protein
MGSPLPKDIELLTEQTLEFLKYSMADATMAPKDAVALLGLLLKYNSDNAQESDSSSNLDSDTAFRPGSQVLLPIYTSDPIDVG